MMLAGDALLGSSNLCVPSLQNGFSGFKKSCNDYIMPGVCVAFT